MAPTDRLLPHDLGDGLVLRLATAADTDALATFNGTIHGGPEETAAHIGMWTRDLLSGAHPAVGPQDFTVVEDTRTGAIVSTLCLISQTWTYDGIPFGVGRTELVGTHPDYRRRGLVRAQFDWLHAESRRRGEIAQAITGIRWYYRQFGYEYALVQHGGRGGAAATVHPLPAGETEPFCVRPATPDDLAFIARTDAEATRRELVACVRDNAHWRYELDGRSPSDRFLLRVIETPTGQPVGYLTHQEHLWHDNFALLRYELAPGVSWAAVTPTALRYLKETAGAVAARDGKDCTWLVFLFGASHPAYEVVTSSLPVVQPAYAWYLRVADLPGFLAHIAPALERRLAASPLAGHTGTLTIDCYRHGVRLVFTGGNLTEVSPWRTPAGTRPDAAFPPETFLQLLFGFRTLDDLTYAYPDCHVYHDTARALLHALFPRHDSHVWGVA